MTPGQRGERGQATVELALLLPVVALVLLAVVQIGLVARDQVVLTHVAREAAREVAVSGDDQGVLAVTGVSGLDEARLRLDVDGTLEPGGRVTVVVHYRATTDVPLVGELMSDPELRATVTVRVEGIT